MMKKRNCKAKHLLAVLLCVSMFSSMGLNTFAAEDMNEENVEAVAESNLATQEMESAQDEPEKIEEQNLLDTKNGEFTVTFDPNGGKLENSVIAKTNAKGKLEKDFQMPKPVREGFEFSDWYTEAEGGEKIQKNETVFTQDTVVYAHWTEKKPQPDQKPQSDKHEGQLTGIEQVNAGGIGTKGDPYRIVADQEHKFTAPEKFWKIQKETAFIKFENRENNIAEGTLLSSYEVDGKQVKPFRFCFINGFDTSTGQLRFAHAWKGTLNGFLKDYEYKINVEYLTKDLPKEKQIHRGDTIKVIQYGNYDEQINNKSKDYSIDFSVTENKPSDLPIWERILKVDDQGFAVFSGENAMERGGNYLAYKITEETAHNVVKIEGKPATCTEDGIKDYYRCEICGKYFEDDSCTNEIKDIDTWKIILASGHDYVWITDKEPSVKEKGLKHQECKVCKHKGESVEIPKIVEASKKPVISSVPKTGDNRNLLVWFTLLAGAGIVVVTTRKKQNSK